MINLCLKLKILYKVHMLNIEVRFYYKVGQPLLQSGQLLCITKWGSFLVLQSGANFIAKWGTYYKVGQVLLQIGEGITK